MKAASGVIEEHNATVCVGRLMLFCFAGLRQTSITARIMTLPRRPVWIDRVQDTPVHALDCTFMRLASHCTELADDSGRTVDLRWMDGFLVERLCRFHPRVCLKYLHVLCVPGAFPPCHEYPRPQNVLLGPIEIPGCLLISAM